MMRTATAILAGLMALGLTACSQEDKEHAERQAGKAAYHVEQGAKKAAEKAGHELHVGAVQAHEGWKEAKHDEKEKKK